MRMRRNRVKDFAARIGCRRLIPLTAWSDPSNVHIVLGGGKQSWVISFTRGDLKRILKSENWRETEIPAGPYLTPAKARDLLNRELVTSKWVEAAG